MKCINLKQQFGDCYKITFDPAYDPQNRPKDKLDPWYIQIACQRGVIYPHGGDRLAAEIEGRPRTARRLRELPCTEVFPDGNNDLAVTFDARDFEKVAELIKPRRRRRVSEENRRKASERMRRLNQQKPSPGRS